MLRMLQNYISDFKLDAAIQSDWEKINSKGGERMKDACLKRQHKVKLETQVFRTQ